MSSSVDIPSRWRGTPIEAFIQAQNLGYPLHATNRPEVLIVSCMEFRYALPVPAGYAYVIRTPGGRLMGSELAVGYVLTKGVRNILLIAHNDCGMTHLVEKTDEIVRALHDQGWPLDRATQFVHEQTVKLAVKDELDALEQEYHRLKGLFRNVHVAPLFLTLSDKRVYIPKWYHDLIAEDDRASARTA
jgi:carbonic anhydrase